MKRIGRNHRFLTWDGPEPAVLQPSLFPRLARSTSCAALLLFAIFGEARTAGESSHLPQAEPAAAAHALASSPAERRAAELFEVMAAGDRRAARSYLDHAFAGSKPEEQVQQDLYDLGRLFLAGRGGLTPLRVIALARNEAALVYRNDFLETNRALIVTVEEASPHRIVAWEKASAPSRGDASPPPLSSAEMVSDIDQYASRLAAADYFSGTILVARGDEILMNRSYGLSDRDHEIPNGSATRYNVASIVKMFTAVAVAQLVERGLLSYDDPLERFVPGYVPDEQGGGVLIRHLLTHTSGLAGNVLVPLVGGEASLRLNSHSEFLAAVPLDQRQLQFTPGSRHLYSNQGYILLGRVIEAASGQDYYDYLRTHVFGPAGMTETAFPPLESVFARRAVGYETFWRDSGPRVENNWLRISARGLASGSAYSTTRDLLRFAGALKTGQLVRQGTFADLTSPQPGSPSYGYGFILRDLGSGRRAAGHTGDDAGVCSAFEMIPASSGPDLTVAVLSNSSMGSCRPVYDRIIQMLSRVGG